MKISTGRKLIRKFARHAGDSTQYPTYMVDFAWRRACNYLIREAQLLLRTDSLTTLGSFRVTVSGSDLVLSAVCPNAASWRYTEDGRTTWNALSGTSPFSGTLTGAATASHTLTLQALSAGSVVMGETSVQYDAGSGDARIYYDLPAGASAFRPERLQMVYLSGPNVVVKGCGSAGYFDESLAVRGGQHAPYTVQTSTRLPVVEYSQVADFQFIYSTAGQPEMLSFVSDSQFAVFPQPDMPYTINFRWSDWFTSWNLGTPLTSFTNTAGILSAPTVVDGSDDQASSMTAAFSDSGSGSGATLTANMSNGSLYSMTLATGGSNYSASTILLLDGFNSADQTVNLPDDLLDEVVSLGAPAFLQYNEPEHAFASQKGQLFVQFVEKLRGKLGGLGVKKVIRR